MAARTVRAEGIASAVRWGWSASTVSGSWDGDRPSESNAGCSTPEIRKSPAESEPAAYVRVGCARETSCTTAPVSGDRDRLSYTVPATDEVSGPRRCCAQSCSPVDISNRHAAADPARYFLQRPT